MQQLSGGNTGALGLGIGWRSEYALMIDRRSDLGFIEVMAEDLNPHGALPEPILLLKARGVTPILHGVSLSLGSAEPPCATRLQHLATLTQRLGAHYVSEHIAFVRGGGIETGHLLPVPRTRAALEILIANIRTAQAALPVPLVLENIASLFEWPEAEMDEATFIAQVVEQSGAGLLLDIENVYANAQNHGFDAVTYLERLPLDKLVYVHVAGGAEHAGLYHDTHAHPVQDGVLALLETLCARWHVPGVMLERDDTSASDEDMNAELDRIAAAVARGAARRAQTGATHV